MKLRDRLEYDGAFLFRWRGHLPLILLVLAIPALFETARMNDRLGEDLSHAWVFLCMGVSVLGQLFRCVTIGFVPEGTSGRGTKQQKADVLNTDGAYSIVRNPLYLGNFVAMLGLAMSLMVWWFVALFVLLYWLYIERIISVEEEFLSRKFGAAYDEWAARTPAFIPNFRLWKPSSNSFSFRTVLRREYHGALAIAGAYFAVEAILDLAIKGYALTYWLTEDYVWVWFFIACCVIYMTLHTLKKQTRLLSPSS